MHENYEQSGVCIRSFDSNDALHLSNRNENFLTKIFSRTSRMSRCRSFAQAASALSTHAHDIDMQLLSAHLDLSSNSQSRYDCSTKCLCLHVGACDEISGWLRHDSMHKSYEHSMCTGMHLNFRVKMSIFRIEPRKIFTNAIFPVHFHCSAMGFWPQNQPFPSSSCFKFKLRLIGPPR